MLETELNKNIKVTEETHQKLTHAKLVMFGVKSMHKVRFSDVIKTLAEKELNEGVNDE